MLSMMAKEERVQRVRPVQRQHGTGAAALEARHHGRIASGSNSPRMTWAWISRLRTLPLAVSGKDSMGRMNSGMS